jgi:hypothetical protein
MLCLIRSPRPCSLGVFGRAALERHVYAIPEVRTLFEHAQHRSLKVGMIKSPFSIWEFHFSTEQNVHHANEPSSCEDGSYGEIRRSCLCHAPLIHLLRGPRAHIVRPWVYGRRKVKTGARGLMAKKPLAERRYRTAVGTCLGQAGSEIMGRERV